MAPALPAAPLRPGETRTVRVGGVGPVPAAGLTGLARDGRDCAVRLGLRDEHPDRVVARICDVVAIGVRRLVAVAFEGETDPALAPLVDEIVWLKVGQLSRMIKACADRGVKQCVMLGQIAPKNLYEVRPDLRAMALLFRLKERNAHTVLAGSLRNSRKRVLN